MDTFIVRILLLEETVMVGIAVILTVAGGVLGSRLFNVQITIRRVAYLWWLAGINLALLVPQMLWAALPTAADFGLISVFAAVLFGCFVLYGMSLYYGSAARSNHIDGTTRRAWLGFVPIANLWLLFKSSGASFDAETAQQSNFSRFVIDPLLIVGALLTFGFLSVLGDEPAFDVSSSQALRQLIIEAQTLEESFASEAEASARDLPVRFDEITVLRDIEARGSTLWMAFDVEEEISAFRPDFKAILAGEYCRPEMFALDIARGGSVVFAYYGPDGAIIQEFEITSKDCLP